MTEKNKKENSEEKTAKEVEKTKNADDDSLEEIVEETEEKISQEELEQFLKVKTKRTSAVLEKIKSAPKERIPFLERELSAETNFQTETRENGNRNSAEYIPKNQNSDGEKKYKSYETDIRIKTKTPEEISASWSSPIQRKEIQFISSENQNPAVKQYDSYISPIKLSDEEIRKRNKFKDFQPQEVNMKYYSSEK